VSTREKPWDNVREGASQIPSAELIIILVLVLANGLLAGAEIAILAVRKTRLVALVESGTRAAKAVLQLRDHPERFLATVQVGITVVSACAAAVGGRQVTSALAVWLEAMGLGRFADEVAFALVIALVSFLSLVLGELVPKSLALRHSERYALFIGRFVVWMAWLSRPVVWALTSSSNAVLSLFGDRTTFTESRLSPEELQQLVEEASRSGSLDPKVGDIASRAFDFSALLVGAVMVPRGQIVAIKKGMKTDAILRILIEEGYSRVPVVEGTLDKVLGYIIAKDALALLHAADLIVLEDILRPVYVVHEATRAIEVLREMQRRRTQLAIVVDEHGTTAGLITIEDLVEELVGDIVSEHEQPEQLIVREGKGRAYVDGTAPLREVNRQLDLSLPDGEGSWSTVAGLCNALAGQVPARGMILTTEDGVEIDVVDASPRRVRGVRLRWNPERSTDRPTDPSQ